MDQKTPAHIKLSQKHIGQHLILSISKGEVCREMLGWSLQDVEEMGVVKGPWLSLAFILQNSHHFDFQIAEGFRYPIIT